MKLLTIIKIVAALLPAIIQFMKVLEEALPASGLGSAKLEALRAILEMAFNAVDDVVVSFSEVWPSIEKVVEVIVKLFNKTTWK